jgi:IS1 family transposase
LPESTPSTCTTSW